MKVSIGVPVCNEANYLRDTLDSLIENNEDIYEIIISDNFSDDSTEIICKEYEKKYSKIKYIRQEKRINSIENFNSVLSTATGDYFFFMRGKNRISKDYVANCKNLLDSNLDVSLVLPIFYKFNEEIPINTVIFYDPRDYDLTSEDAKTRFLSAIKFPINCMAIYGFFRLKTLKKIFNKLDYEESACDNVLLYRYVLSEKCLIQEKAISNHYYRVSESYDLIVSRYQKMGFSVDKNNLFWYLPFEAIRLCRLHNPKVYDEIKDNFRACFNISLQTPYLEEDYRLTRGKGNYVKNILEKSYKKKIAFFGTSSCAEKINKLLDNRLVPDIYLDNNKSKQGTLFYGKKVYPPSYIKNKDYVCVVNVDESRFVWQIYEQMTGLGFVYMENLFFLAREVRDNFV